VRLHQRHAFLDRGVDRHCLERKVELAGLDLGKVEEIVDQAEQMRARDVNIVQVAPIALVADRPETLAHHHLREADDGIERCADLMADLGEEVRLLSVRCLCRPPRRDQFLLDVLPVGNVAEHRAVLVRRADPPHGHE